MHRLLVIAALLVSVEASVYHYKDVALRPDALQYRRVAMWAPGEAPSSGRPGDGSSSIGVDLTFRRRSASSSAVLQVLIFQAENLHRVGTLLSSTGSRTFCCSDALVSRRVAGCREPGKVIVADPPAGHVGVDQIISVHDVQFASNQTHATYSGRVPVKVSGVHYLVISHCGTQQMGSFTYSGRTAWRNPYGFLPAELYPFLPFYGLMTLVYFSLAAGWAYLCYTHWSQLLPLQRAIGWVLLLGVVEGATWYMAYRAFNHGGNRGMLPTTLGVLASTVRKTVARLLVLAVCLGYGVVRPTLGTTAVRVGLFGAVYFVFAAALDVASNVSTMSEYSVPVRLLFIMPVALLDVLFYWWTFSALMRTLSQLSGRRQSAKLLLYRRFASVLLIELAVAAIWAARQLSTIVSEDLDEEWASLWVFDAFWHGLYFCVLLSITWLWSPNMNNQTLVWHAQDEDFASEEEAEE